MTDDALIDLFSNLILGIETNTLDREEKDYLIELVQDQLECELGREHYLAEMRGRHAAPR